MLIQIGDRGKLFETLFALEGLFSAVDFSVAQKIRHLRKLLLAVLHVASVGLFSRVYPYMLLEDRLEVVLFITEFTKDS